MTKTLNKITLGLIVILAIALFVVSGFAYADATTSLTIIDDTSKLNIDSILDCFSDEYLNEYADTEVIVIAKYNDSASHSIKSDLEDLDIESRYSYDTLFNGESFSIKIKDLYQLSNLSYIESVSLAQEYYELSIDEESYEYTDSSNTSSGIFKNETGYYGEGMVVAVIDAGFDTSHVAFSHTADVLDTLSQSSIKTALYELNSYKTSGVSSQSLYVSKKIAYAYDYGEEDLDVYSSTSSHGTHVAGIIAGESAEDEIGAELIGVAKHAQLALMKVADSNGYMYSDTIAAALEDCLKLNVDVVNMSLGSSSGFSSNEDDLIYKAIDKLEEAGISVVCAAGNESTSAQGSESKTDKAPSEYVDNSAVSSPASYNESISIANATEAHWFTLQGSSDKITYFNSYNTSTSKYGEFSQDILDGATSLDVEYVVLKNGNEIAIGQSSDYTEDVTGKIVVVKRGDITFTQKAQIAKEHGAIGVIIVNTDSTTITPQVTVDDIAACVVSQDVGTTLDNASNKTLSFDEGNVRAVIATSSSKGVSNDLNLAVDVTGYGTSVKSSINNQEYGQMTGTSMASPNVAGVFLVVKQYVKDNNTLFDIDLSLDSAKEQITKTATKLIMSNTTLLTDLNDVLVSPRAQGAGLASISDAIAANAYISTSSEYKTKIELGDNLTKNITLEFTIQNFNSSPLSLDLSIDVLTELLVNGYMSGMEKNLTFTIDSVNGTTDTTIDVPGESSKDVTVVITLSDDAITYLNTFENGTYIEGYIQLDGSGLTLSCPFIGFYGNWDNVPILDATSYEDEDDVYMRASTSYGIYADSYYLPLGKYVYKLADDYEGDEVEASEELASLSIFSQSMYALGYIQLGLLRSAEYIEINVVDLMTNEVIYTTSQGHVYKTLYQSGYSMLYGGDLFPTISPYSLDLYNNAQYEVQVNVYRKYTEGGDNTISDTYTQKFYVDEEDPVIDDISATTQNNRYLATFTMSDNHYIQALAICTGSGSSTSSVTLNVEDIYPITTKATGVGQTIEVTFDVTDAIKNASNGYLYFYVVDYAQNNNIYYYSVGNWTGTSSSISDKGSSSTTSSSSKPTTESNIAKSFEFKETETTIYVNQTVNLASNQYLTSYSIDGKYTWSSSDEEIVAISNGKIAGFQEGIAVVSVVDEDGNEAKLIVNVIEAPFPLQSAAYKSTSIDTYTMKDTVTNDGSAFFGINLDGTSIKLAPGESFELSFKYSPFNYNYIQYPSDVVITITSDDTSKVAVDGYTLSAEAAGISEVVITAQYKTDAPVEIARYTIEVVDEMYAKDGVLIACFKDSSSITVPAGITAIGSNAFTYAKNVTEVILTDVTTIYKNAFKDNTSIQTIDLSSVTSIYASAFEGCTSLSTVNLSSATYIGDSAFKACKNLTSVTFDSGNINLLSISANAFDNCERLENFTIGTATKNIIIGGELILTLDFNSVLENSTIRESIISIGYGALANIQIKNLDFSTLTNLERIEAQAFANNETLERITLPASIKYIGSYAFAGCNNLMSLTIEKGTNQTLEIGDFAFAETKLSVIDLSGIETTFNDGAFFKCFNLTYANLGSVQEMGEYTFGAATDLMSVVFESGTKDIGTYTFAPITISSKTYYHAALKKVTLPNGVETIGEYVFAYCTSLSFKNVSLNSVKEVGDYAFLNCTSITEVNLPSVEKLEYAAFAQSSIQSIKLNTSMTTGTLTIGELAFYQCEYLKTALLPTNSNVSVEIEKGAFYKCTLLESYSQTRSRTMGFPPMVITTESGINFDRVTKIGDYAFTGCEALESATLTSCKSIGYAAFADCDLLETVTMPVIESIDRVAFYKTAIKTLTIPNTIKSIGQAAFCETYISVQLDKNQDYSSSNILIDNGVVYIKLYDGTYMLVYYPENLDNEKYTILENTSIIGEYAFLDNDDLETIVIPSGVKTIGNGAFYGCDSLSTVIYKGTTLPKLLGQYSTSNSSLYSNFVDYDEDDYTLILVVEDEATKTLFSNNKTWSTIADYILVGNEDSAYIKFLEKYDALAGQTITSKNKAEFEELKALYDALSDDEKALIEEDASVKAGYAKMLEEYNSINNSIIDNITDSTGLKPWVVILIISISAVVLVLSAIAITFLLTKRHLDIKRIKETSQETKELDDIFGTSENSVEENTHDKDSE